MDKVINSWEVHFDVDGIKRLQNLEKDKEMYDKIWVKIKENYPRHYNPNIDYVNKLKDLLYERKGTK